MTQVALRNVHKRFAATEALRGANLELEPAEIHALLGENGAGKSTLVRVLYGLVEPDRGEIRIDDVPVSITSPRHALALVIGLVHQHFMGVPALSVAENLMLGQHGSLARRHAAPCAQLERYLLGLYPDRFAF